MSLVQHAVENQELIEYFWKHDHSGKRIKKVGMMVGFVRDTRLCIGASKCYSGAIDNWDADKFNKNKAYIIAHGRAWAARSSYHPIPDGPYAKALDAFVLRCEKFFKLEYKGEKSPCSKKQASL